MQLSYDNQGQLATWANAPGSSPTASASYLYDGEGHRVEQVATTSGVTTITTYVGSLEEVATTGSNTTTTAYYGALATSVNGALSYTLADGLGSVSEAVNTATGAVTASQLYAPYGAVRYQSGTLPGSRGFTGQHSDAATSGLDYYGARYYDPLAGQFTSADSVLPKKGVSPDPSQFNRYAYVAGNPETRTDPSGHYFAAPTGSSETGGPCWKPCARPVHGQTHNPTPLRSPHESGWVSGFSPAFGAGGGAATGEAVWAMKMAKALNQPTVEVSSYVRANGTVVEPYVRRPPGAGVAAAEAEEFSRVGKAMNLGLVGIGFVIDAGASGYSYYQSDDASDPDRTEKAVIAGAMHGVISTGVAFLFGTAVAAIPVVGESGVAEIAAGMLGAQLGGSLADAWVTPDRVDAATSFVNAVSTSFVDAIGTRTPFET